METFKENDNNSNDTNNNTNTNTNYSGKEVNENSNSNNEVKKEERSLGLEKIVVQEYISNLDNFSKNSDKEKHDILTTFWLYSYIVKILIL
mgnify:CR=1 FL=1